MSTTDHTREALIETVLSAHWPDGTALALTSKTAAFVADAIIASPWLAAHVAAVVEGKDAEIQLLRTELDTPSAAITQLEQAVQRRTLQRDEARAAVAAERALMLEQLRAVAPTYRPLVRDALLEVAELIARSSTDGGGTDE